MLKERKVMFFVNTALFMEFLQREQFSAGLPSNCNFNYCKKLERRFRSRKIPEKFLQQRIRSLRLLSDQNEISFGDLLEGLSLLVETKK